MNEKLRLAIDYLVEQATTTNFKTPRVNAYAKALGVKPIDLLRVLHANVKHLPEDKQEQAVKKLNSVEETITKNRERFGRKVSAGLKNLPEKKQQAVLNQLQKNIERFWSGLTPEEQFKVRSEGAKKQYRTATPLQRKRKSEKLSRATKKAHARKTSVQTREQRQHMSDIAKKQWRDLSPDERAERGKAHGQRVRDAIAKRTPDEQARVSEKLRNSRTSKERSTTSKAMWAKKRKSILDATSWRKLDWEQARIEKSNKEKNPFSVLNDKRNDRKKRKR